jgi:G protein beta subunit-like protein
LTLSFDGKYLGACTHGHVKVYDLRHLDQERIFDGLNGNAVAMDFQKQNKWFFAACEDGTIKIFDFKAQGYQRQYDNGGVMINCAVLHPNEVEIIFGDQNGEIKVWDLQLQKARSFCQIEMPQVSITALEISKDAKKLIMGNSAGIFCVWESEGTQIIQSTAQGQIQQVNYGSTEDFNPIQDEEAHPDQYILRCKLSPNKKYLATCSSDRTCKIWAYNGEVEEFQHHQTLSGHGGWVWDCDFTVDNMFCITVSTDQRIRIWKIEEAKVKKLIMGHSKGITALAFKDMS